MSNIIFDVGDVRILTSGATPAPVADATECTVELDSKTVSYNGANKYAIDTASIGGDLTGTLKVAGRDALALQALLDGTRTAGARLVVFDEELTIPTTPFKVTVAAGTDFELNLGVKRKATGAVMEYVVATPTVGQYTFVPSTGEFEFAAADVGLVMLVSYVSATTTGSTIKIVNGGASRATLYSLVSTNSYDGQTVTYIPKVVFGAIKPLVANKLNAYADEISISFSASAPSGSSVIEISSLTEAEKDAALLALV
jgi:hypothetical protein